MAEKCSVCRISYTNEELTSGLVQDRDSKSVLIPGQFSFYCKNPGCGTLVYREVEAEQVAADRDQDARLNPQV